MRVAHFLFPILSFHAASCQTVLNLNRQINPAGAEIDFDSAISANFPDFYNRSKHHDLNELFNLHKSLVDIQSVSKNEAAVGSWLIEYLEAAGFAVETQPLDGSRFNIYSYHKSAAKTARNKKILLTSHIDTVPPFIKYSFDPSTGEIRGRGSNDAKGLVAVQVFAALELIKEGLIAGRDVGLLFVVGEEIDGDGMKHAVAQFTEANRHLDAKHQYKWDVVIFGEPTENKLGIGHKGNYVFDLQTHGLAAHSGYPQLGISSNEIIVEFLHQLKLAKFPYSDLLGPTTFNVGILQGGIALNVLPAFSHANVFFRVADDIDALHKVVTELIASVNRDYRALYPHYNQSFVVQKNLHTKLPQFLDFEVDGFESIALAYATDIPSFTFKVKKRFLYGPGSILSAHGDNEAVTIFDIVESVQGYKDLVVKSKQWWT